MPGAAGADDPALEQARLAQPPLRAYQDGWRSRYAGISGASAPQPPAPVDTAATAPPSAQRQASAASPGGGPAQAGSNGWAAQAAGPGHGAHPKPVAPALKPEEREAGRLKALQLAAARKELREQLQKSQITLEQALTRDDEAARGMRVETAVKALPNVGPATIARLMAQVGINAGRRVGGLTTGQRTRLLTAVAAVRR